MTTKEKLQLSDGVIQQGINLGIGRTESEVDKALRSAARSSAIVTHPEGNRRYYDLVLDIEDNVLYSVSKYTGSRPQAVHNGCFDCGGSGVQKQGL
mgnify:CR=1 FL=1